MMTMRNRVWPLCLAAFLFLAAVQAAFFPLGAAAETAPVAEATLLPADAESASPYRIVLTAPGGWSSGNSAVMKVSVTDINLSLIHISLPLRNSSRPAARPCTAG